MAIGGLVLVSTGWVLAQVFESPAQREAAATPPPPGDVTARVERGPLADTITVAVDVERLRRTEIAVAVDDGQPVVTARPVADGGVLKVGRPVLEVNGRPVVMLTGKFPMYRDLAPGATGPDVRQLQQALVAAGYSVTVDGRFGSGTRRAVDALYRHIGYDPPDALPLNEVIVIPSLPAQLVSAPPVGSVSDDDEVVIASGGLVAVAGVPAETVARLDATQSAVLQPSDGSDIPARIASIGDVDDETHEARLTLVPVDGKMPAESLGASMLAVITIEIVEADALLVPSVAVTPNGNGEPFVIRIDADGTRHRVTVRELGTLAGVSAIEPLDPDELTEHDVVKVD